MQRLLWEIGGSVAFGPPTVNQLRNAHNLMRDFQEEQSLYIQAGKLVDILNDWKPPAQSSLPQMMTSLAQRMADENLWEQVRLLILEHLIFCSPNLVDTCVQVKFPLLRNIGYSSTTWARILPHFAHELDVLVLKKTSD